jgi:hypothetical protein
MAHCSSMVQSLSDAAILLPALLSAMWLNNGMLWAANYMSSLAHMWCCAPAPLLFLLHYFEIAFTSRFTYVHMEWFKFNCFVPEICHSCWYKPMCLFSQASACSKLWTKCGWDLSAHSKLWAGHLLVKEAIHTEAGLCRQISMSANWTK